MGHAGSNAVLKSRIGLIVLALYRIQSPKYRCFTKTSITTESNQTMCPDREMSTHIDQWTESRRPFRWPSDDKTNFPFEQTHWPISSSRSIRLSSPIGSPTRWIECRSQILNRTNPSRTIEDLVLKHRVFHKNLHKSGQQWSSLFSHAYLSISHRDASESVSI